MMLWQPPLVMGDTFGGQGDSLRPLVFFLRFSSCVGNADVSGLSCGSGAFQTPCAIAVFNPCLYVTAEAFLPSLSVPFQNRKKI